MMLLIMRMQRRNLEWNQQTNQGQEEDIVAAEETDNAINNEDAMEETLN